MPYADLLADWRGAMTHAQAQLGITFNADLTSNEHHDVDDFIDVKLNRSKVTWDDVDTIPELQEQGNEAWDACNTLVDAPYDAEAIAVLDRVHDRYVVLHQFAEAITLDHTNVCVAQERRQVQARLREKHQEQTAELKERLARRRQEVKRLKAQLGQVEPSEGKSRLPWKR